MQKTVAIGLYPQGNSLQGVADLSGNVLEWCLNEYNKPDNVQTSGSLVRVARGGTWFRHRDLARASSRTCRDPDTRSCDIGFRVCCLSPIMIAGG